jgi:sulfur carrier protein ThiS
MSHAPGHLTITVTLMADLRRHLPRGVDGAVRYTLPAGATVADLLAAIGIAPDADITIGVDGALAQSETALSDGADVLLVSPMEGGSTPRGDPGTRARPPCPGCWAVGYLSSRRSSRSSAGNPIWYLASWR